tara:strand:+ start:865 stop:1590 length:726 start_codon:yes stop_codon:yes gene_type:complete
MSTRATYQFHHNDTFKADTTIYIHSDGYPEGAAHYIYLALRPTNENEFIWPIEDKKQYFTVEDFIRTNPKAEITGHHATHPDTEYKYDFRNCTGYGLFSLDSSVTVYSRRYGEKWKQHSHSTIEEFLIQFPAIERNLRAFCGYDKPKPITQFKKGEKYYFRFKTDYDLICKYEVVRRSDKSVWLTPIEKGDGHQKLGEVSRFVISIYDNTENVMPLGRYSMAPCLRADKLVSDLDAKGAAA